MRDVRETSDQGPSVDGPLAVAESDWIWLCGRSVESSGLRAVETPALYFSSLMFVSALKNQKGFGILTAGLCQDFQAPSASKKTSHCLYAVTASSCSAVAMDSYSKDEINSKPERNRLISVVCTVSTNSQMLSTSDLLL